MAIRLVRARSIRCSIRLSARGYLKSKAKRLGRTFRRVYRATALGKEANKIAKIQVRELTGGGG